MKSWKVKTLACVGSLFMASAASAATYQIIVSGLNITYTQSSGTICDSSSCDFITNGIGGATSDDPLSTMTFIKDGVDVLILTGAAGISADVVADIANGTSPNVNSQNAVAAGGIFDFLIGNLPGIATNITSGTVSFTTNSLNLGGTGLSNIELQNLPVNPGLGADWVGFNPINWSFSSGTKSCTGATGSEVCTYSGSGELSWTTVPEPGSLLLLGLGLVGLGYAGRKQSVK